VAEKEKTPLKTIGSKRAAHGRMAWASLSLHAGTIRLAGRPPHSLVGLPTAPCGPSRDLFPSPDWRTGRGGAEYASEIRPIHCVNSGCQRLAKHCRKDSLPACDVNNSVRALTNDPFGVK